MAPPQRVYVQKAEAIEPKGSVMSTFETLISPENRAVVISITAFGAAVAFLSSSLGEAFLLPG